MINWQTDIILSTEVKLVMLPGQRHGFGDMTEYFFWKMGDYFVQHLLGDNTPSPVDMIEMQRDKPKNSDR